MPEALSTRPRRRTRRAQSIAATAVPNCSRSVPLQRKEAATQKGVGSAGSVRVATVSGSGNRRIGTGQDSIDRRTLVAGGIHDREQESIAGEPHHRPIETAIRERGEGPAVTGQRCPHHNVNGCRFRNGASGTGHKMSPRRDFPPIETSASTSGAGVDVSSVSVNSTLAGFPARSTAWSRKLFVPSLRVTGCGGELQHAVDSGWRAIDRDRAGFRDPSAESLVRGCDGRVRRRVSREPEPAARGRVQPSIGT